MSKVAFCFPGQGSLEAGMGREIAEAVPEAMAVFTEGSEAADARATDIVVGQVQRPQPREVWRARQPAHLRRIHAVARQAQRG